MSTSGNIKYKEKMPRAVQIYPCQCDFCSHHTRCCRASQTLTKTELYAWYEFWQKPCNSNFISCSYITVSHHSSNVPMPLTSNCFKLYGFIFVICIWLQYVKSIHYINEHAHIYMFVWEYWPDNENPLGKFPGPLPQSVSFMVAIKRSMLEDKDG